MNMSCVETDRLKKGNLPHTHNLSTNGYQGSVGVPKIHGYARGYLGTYRFCDNSEDVHPYEVWPNSSFRSDVSMAVLSQAESQPGPSTPSIGPDCERIRLSAASPVDELHTE